MFNIFSTSNVRQSDPYDSPEEKTKKPDKAHKSVADFSASAPKNHNVETLLCSASFYLRSRQFSDAERFAEQALMTVTGEKKYIEYSKITQDPLAPEKNKAAAQQALTRARHQVNSIANQLFLSDMSFRRNMEQYIMSSITQGTNSACEVRDFDGAVLYRSVRPNGNYGTPESVFKIGMAPQFMPIWGFQGGGFINKPYVNDALTAGENRPTTGWTGGVVSLSSSFDFVSQFKFAEQYGQQDGFIYAVATGRCICVSEGLTKHTGEGAVTNAADAEEFVPAFIPPENIIGCRPVFRDGHLGDFIVNPNCKISASGDKEFLKFHFSKDVFKSDDTLIGDTTKIRADHRAYFQDSRADTILDLKEKRNKPAASNTPTRYVTHK